MLPSVPNSLLLSTASGPNWQCSLQAFRRTPNTRADRYEDHRMSTDTGSYETLLYTERDGIAFVTLNRPDALNAFDSTMMREVQDLWRALRSNDDVRCVVLTGAGERAFCVGIDRNADDTYVVFERRTLYGTSNNYMYDDPGRFLGPKSNDLWKPVICSVNGMACGGAFYMIAESDIVIAA